MRKITFLMALFASLALFSQNNSPYWTPSGDERCFDNQQALLCVGDCNTSLIDQYQFNVNIENDMMICCLRELNYSLCPKYSSIVQVYINGNMILSANLGNNFSAAFTVNNGDNVLVYLYAFDNLSGLICKQLGSSNIEITSEY